MTSASFTAFSVTNGLLFTSVILFALGCWLAFDHRHRFRDTTFAALMVTIALWTFSFVLADVSGSPTQRWFWQRELFVLGSAAPACFLLLACTYAFERMPRRLVQFLALAPCALVLLAVFFTDLVVQGPLGTLGPLHAVFAGLFTAYVIAALALFLHASLGRRLLARGSAVLVILGAVVTFGSMLIALYGERVLPGTFPVAAVSALLMLGIVLIGVAVVRKRPVIDLRMFGVELLLLLILLVSVTETLLAAETILVFSFRLVILLLLIIYGVLSVRTYVREMHRLREVEGLHERLAKLNHVLMRADRLKTRFVSFASHQLRAPLGGIRGYLDMMHRGDFGALSDTQKHIIAMNLDATTRLMQTIEMFLDVTKIELGKFDLYKAETDLRELTERVISEMRPLAEKKKLELRIESEDGLPHVMVDSSKLFHVIINFLDNAIKYTEQGSVVVRLRREGHEIAIDVADTGIGMDDADRDRLFHLFERGISAVKLESSGEGLGLYIVKNIAEAHGGRVVMDSAGKGKGSTFGIRLPYEREE